MGHRVADPARRRLCLLGQPYDRRCRPCRAARLCRGPASRLATQGNQNCRRASSDILEAKLRGGGPRRGVSRAARGVRLVLIAMSADMISRMMPSTPETNAFVCRPFNEKTLVC